MSPESGSEPEGSKLGEQDTSKDQDGPRPSPNHVALSSLTGMLVKPVRARIGKKEKARIAEFLDFAYGHKCELCGKANPQETLEIDHKNGLGNNALTDFRWLCKRCNLATRYLNDSARLASVSVRNGAGGAHYDEDALQKNRRTEPAWVEYISNQLKASDGLPLKRNLLTSMSAKYVDISVSTVNRHWIKWASPIGPFHVFRPDQGTEELVEFRKKPEPYPLHPE